jgi:hypothetical protein
MAEKEKVTPQQIPDGKADGRGADALVGGLYCHGRATGSQIHSLYQHLGIMGLKEDAFIPEVDSFAGAATFLG